jgi:putative transposase
MRALTNKALDAKVQAVHRDSRGSYGQPRITQQLRQQGEHVSAERVRPNSQAPRAAPGISTGVVGGRHRLEASLAGGP